MVYCNQLIDEYNYYILGKQTLVSKQTKNHDITEIYE